MPIVTFYRNDPNAPKPTQRAHLGANILIICGDKLLLEKRRDSETWGLIGGGVKKWETEIQAAVREIYEETGLRVKPEALKKLKVYGEPGRIAAYQDGSIWRMVIVAYELMYDEEPKMKISDESRQLKFFTREEVRKIPIVVTHSDIVEDWFLNVSAGQNAEKEKKF